MFTCEPYIDDAGEHRWRVVHDNGHIVADSSEGYENAADRDHIMEVLFGTNPNVTIVTGT